MREGYRNKITDVKSVRVGHKTMAANNVQTSVTVILLTEGDILHEKPTASCRVISDFRKISGLIQLEEPGVLESSTALTNTLYVGTVQQALVCYMLQDHPEIGTTSSTVNVVIGEYDDGYLNDIRACSIQESNVYEAIADVRKDFALGAVGVGHGMSCSETKGGIGSASRMLELNRGGYTVGFLVLSNFGLENGYIRENVSFHGSVKKQVKQGNTIIILAADIPMSDRQLKRICKRIPVALARLGPHLGNDSGDTAIVFSTANKVPRSANCSFVSQTVLHKQQIDKVFRTGIEVCEEAIQSSLDAAETVVGKEGHYRYSLKDTIAEMKRG